MSSVSEGEDGWRFSLRSSLLDSFSGIAPSLVRYFLLNGLWVAAAAETLLHSRWVTRMDGLCGRDLGFDRRGGTGATYIREESDHRSQSSRCQCEMSIYADRRRRTGIRVPQETHAPS